MTEPFVRMFRVRVGRRKLQVHVFIHPDKESMVRAHGGRMTKFVAFTRCFSGKPVAAEIHMQRGDIDRGTVAHEAVHAASGLMARMGRKSMQWRFTSGNASDAEEVFAQYVGQVTSATLKVARMGKFRCQG